MGALERGIRRLGIGRRIRGLGREVLQNEVENPRMLVKEVRQGLELFGSQPRMRQTRDSQL
jgi:hypothetical protein